MKYIEKGEADHAEFIEDPLALSEEWRSWQLSLEMVVSGHSSSMPLDSDSLLPEALKSLLILTLLLC